MTIIGNILFVLSSLIYIGLVNILYMKDAPRGGDYAVGHAWAILILNGAFIITILLAYSFLAAKGGFYWVGSNSTSRFFIVSICLIAAIITTFLSGMFKDEHGSVPAFVRMLSNIVPIIVPLVLIVSGFILLNMPAASVALYKWPLIIIGSIGIIGCLAFAGAFIIAKNAKTKAKIENRARFEDSNHQRMLEQIEKCDVTKDMVFIFVFTDANQDADIREKAVAKIKTNPQWQQELVRRLQNGWAPEAFNYLASNPVDNPELFTESIKEGIINQAKLIRERIRNNSHPSHFYAGLFSWEVERVIRTVNNFKGNNTSYLGEMKELRSALDERSDFDKPVFTCSLLLDEWIKKQK